MINIYVDGRLAVLKQSFEFEYNIENDFFEESSGYSLSIEFPMEGCDRNLEIFGNMQRNDVDKETALLPCEIFCGAFHRRGALAVLEVSESVLKGQFLEGVDPADEDCASDSLYINQLDLGAQEQPDPSKITPLEARQGNANAVCLPWVPEGYDVVNNHADSATEWNGETRRLSWQPYLLPMVRRIAAGAGYSIDISALEQSEWRRAIICNSVPPTWEMDGYAAALPHWTVREFFEKLGLFLRGVFSIDESEKRISFGFWDRIRKDAGEVAPVVVDEYSSTVTRDEVDADFLPVKNLRYRTPEHELWKYLDAPWLRERYFKEAHVVETAAELGKYTYDSQGHRHGGGMVQYCRELDTYFVYRPVIIYSKGHVEKKVSDKYPYAKLIELQPVDVFGPAVYDPKEDTDYTELEIVPVTVDFDLLGKMMHLPVGNYPDDGTGSSYDPLDSATFDKYDGGAHGIKTSNGIWLSDSIAISKSRINTAIEYHSDEDDNDDAFFDCIFIGMVHDDIVSKPYPRTDVDTYGGKILSAATPMRLKEGGVGGTGIEPRVKYSFTFVADTVPDINATFSIHGRKYVCRKITARFDSRGLYPLLKGEFFRLSPKPAE